MSLSCLPLKNKEEFIMKQKNEIFDVNVQSEQLKNEIVLLNQLKKTYLDAQFGEQKQNIKQIGRNGNSEYNSNFKGIYGCPECDDDTSGITENIEVSDGKITVYEKKGQTIRTVIEFFENKIVIENTQKDGESITKINYSNLNNEEVNPPWGKIARIKV